MSEPNGQRCGWHPDGSARTAEEAAVADAAYAAREICGLAASHGRCVLGRDHGGECASMLSDVGKAN